MSDADLWWIEPPDSPLQYSDYIELGRIFIAEGAEKDLEECEPLERAVRLMHLGDQEVLGSEHPDENWYYGLAVESVLDPHLQLELGCLLLQRANADEMPLCEHTYTKEHGNYDPSIWNPRTAIHDEVGSGSPSTNRANTIRLASRAYGNAWSYYKWGHAGSRHYLFRSLLALDGLRVCYSELNDFESAWKLCSGLERWLGDLSFEFGEDAEVDKFVDQVRVRFAGTKGRLEPMMVGRAAAVKRLEREISWWDSLPARVKDYLADAEYMRSLLTDRTYNPKGVIAAYCFAVEAILQMRLGAVLDTYLQGAPESEANLFRSDFLQARDKRGRVATEWKCVKLTMNQFARYLTKTRFKNLLSKAGADAKFCFQELPSTLRKLLDYRNPASHAQEEPFSQGDVAEVRALALDVLGNLVSVMPMLSPESR